MSNFYYEKKKVTKQKQTNISSQHDKTEIVVKKSKTPKTRRKTLVALAGAGVIWSIPSGWHKPLVNSIILPAHAQTSPPDDEPPVDEPPVDEPPVDEACSGFETEPVSESITVTVTDTEIRGPIIITRVDPMAFDGFEAAETGSMCSETDNFSEEITFNGTIDPTNSQITGEFILRQFCGEALVCEQITDYVVDQTPPAAGDDLGVYNGTATGTLRCCIDFL